MSKRYDILMAQRSLNDNYDVSPQHKNIDEQYMRGFLDPSRCDVMYEIDEDGHRKADLSRLFDYDVNGVAANKIMSNMTFENGTYAHPDMSDDDIMLLTPPKHCTDIAELEAWKDAVTDYIDSHYSDIERNIVNRSQSDGSDGSDGFDGSDGSDGSD